MYFCSRDIRDVLGTGLGGIATWGVMYNGMGCHECDTISDGLGGADANG